METKKWKQLFFLSLFDQQINCMNLHEDWFMINRITACYEHEPHLASRRDGIKFPKIKNVMYLQLHVITFEITEMKWEVSKYG